MVNVWGSNGSDLIHIAGDGGDVGGTGVKDVALATDGDDIIYARDGDDLIRSGGGVDVAYGGIGNDVFILRAASDLAVGEGYYGGEGFDWLDGSVVTLPASLDGMAVMGIEGLYGFGGGLTLHAAQLARFSKINTGTLTLLDGGTMDLSGAIVATTRFVFSDQATALTLTLDPDSASGFKGFHGTILGGAGADVVTVQTRAPDLQNPGVVTVRGGAGDDTLSVGTGHSKIFGDGGNDTIFLGFGGSLAYGGNGSDRIDIAFPVAGAKLSGGSGQDTLTGSVMGDPFDLTTCLLSGFEVITGFQAEVTMSSLQASKFIAIDLAGGLRIKDGGYLDLARTHLGDMSLFLSDEINLVTLASWAYARTVSLDMGGGDDLLEIVAPTGLHGLRVQVDGGAGRDVIIGGFRSDTLNGGADDDVLNSGAGDDVLTGGLGSDVFQLVKGMGADTVTDYSGLRSDVTADRLEIWGGVSPVRYLGDALFTAKGVTEARFDGRAIVVDLDGNGRGDLTVILTGMTAAGDLTGDDFAWPG